MSGDGVLEEVGDAELEAQLRPGERRDVLEFTARNEIVLDVGVSCPLAVPKDEPRFPRREFRWRRCQRVERPDS